jgi:capsid protein
MLQVVKALAVAAIAVCAMAGVSHAGNFIDPTGTKVSACDDGSFLRSISTRFDYQVRNVPGLPVVSITDFRDIHEHRYIPRNEEWPISRRYCGATVILSDGSKRDLWYLIEARMGFVAARQNVEFCVSGFDRWFVYNGNCRVLK